MRLLHTRDLIFQEFFARQVPKYAILSHRWGKDEVSYQEFLETPQELRSTDSRFWKIVGACALAAGQGLEWTWIDTCCINKESSAELTEAINSMYTWYQRSKVCHVYMADVEWDGSSPLSPEVRQSFKDSDWFKRGWTLQELLAPGLVAFYDTNGKCIGDKIQLSEEISAATNIEASIFHNAVAARSACVAKRMSWAANRMTTRTEDMAYCLLGLFDVNMPLLYGEGEKAFMRLQLEIIKKTDDESIFAWKRELRLGVASEIIELPSFGQPSGLLAAWPTDFRNSINISTDFWKVNIRSLPQPRLPYSMTNKGLQYSINMPGDEQERVHSGSRTSMDLLLNCYEAGIGTGVRSGLIVGITLAKFGISWHRIDCDKLKFHKYEEDIMTDLRMDELNQSNTLTIYVPQDGI